MPKKVKLITERSSIRRILLRRFRRRIRKSARKISKGFFHVQASFNNTIISVTDEKGGVIYWSCAGTCRFKGPRKGTVVAARIIAEDASRVAKAQGMRRANVLIKGPGHGRRKALEAIYRSGILVNFVRDVTPLPHNGCRPPNKRRK
uniref:Small ribosomal subunit protein uS11c n=1 Tax=Passiflora jatunsachensis TaxID=1341363 RepID=A0A4Y5QFT0_9ROSI|nr:ribosomal protein S11 [Passiflora jatunsachensis]YP_009670486.1 ribosomal protein S11 [Passiflora jatunsachensis]QCX29740.1 ribosomal protein S11 [Passiflora jatunsachensis]QCX29741.1 ribosomal protein S11 [Passiflora jatunsachensis]